MQMQTHHGFAAVLAIGLAPSFVHGQEADHQARLDAAHDQYEQFIAERDFEGLVGMFAEDAVYQPATGGLFQGRDEIRQWHEEANFASMEIEQTHVRPLSEGMVVDLGSYTATLADAPDTLSGEYVAVVEMDGDEARIQSLTAFPTREMNMPAGN